MLSIILTYKNLGYDYAPVFLPGFAFEMNSKTAKKSCSMNEGGVIYDRTSFETYNWPDHDVAAYQQLTDIAPFLPNSMKLAL